MNVYLIVLKSYVSYASQNVKSYSIAMGQIII